MKRLLRIAFYSLLALLMLALAGLMLLPVKDLAAARVKAYLAAHGVTRAEFTVAALNFSGIEIRDVTLGKAANVIIGKVTLPYRWQALKTGKLDGIELENVAITGTLKDGHLSLGELDALYASSGGKADRPVSLALPLTGIRLRNADIHILADTDTWALHLDALDIRQPNDKALEYEITRLTLPGNAGIPALSLKGVAKRVEDTLHADFALQPALPIAPATCAVNADATLQNGNAECSLPPLAFARGGLQPGQLFPALSVLKNASGTVSGTLSHRWEGNKKSQALTLPVSHFTAQIGDVIIHDMNGTLAFDRLSPLMSDGTQYFNIAELIVGGIPLTHGLAPIDIQQNRVTLEPTVWQWAGGTLATERILLSLTDPKLEALTLNVHNIEMQDVLAIFLKEGLSAQGKLNGRIPLRLKDGQLMIDAATLGSAPGGVIHYTPQGGVKDALGNNPQSEMLLKALSNFHYKAANITLNSVSETLFVADLHIAGSNPELYDGKAIELNIHLQGDIADLIKSGLKAYALPEALEKRLTQ